MMHARVTAKMCWIFFMRHSVYGCRQSLISGNVLVIIEKIIKKDTLDCCTGGNQLMVSHDVHMICSES